MTVTANDDETAEGNHVSILTHTANSSDVTYDDIEMSSVSTDIVDNDSAGILVSAISGHTSEGGTTATATVVLTSAPTSSVTIGLSSSDTTEGTIAPSFFVFNSSNWDEPQTVTVTGVNDDVDDEAVTYTIVTTPASSSDLNYNTQNAGDLTVINDDNDSSGFTVSVISGNVTEASGNATFTVVLLSEPTGDVTVGLSSSDTTEGTVSPSSLTFTSANWDIVQTVTVTGVNDVLVDGNLSFNILTAAAVSTDPSYNGVDPSNLVVINEDNDSAGVTVTPTTLSGTEGNTKEYTMVLNTEPTSNVMISILTDGEVSRSPNMITFTPLNWNVPQYVTLTLLDDSTIESTETSSVIHGSFSIDSAYDELSIVSVSVNILDNDEEDNQSGGGSGGSGSSSGGGQSGGSSNNPPSTPEVSDTEELVSELSEETPDHWSEGYLQNLIDETYIIDVAVKMESFLEVLFSFFVAPDSGTNRQNALSFLLVQSGIDVSTIQVNVLDPSFSDTSTLDEDFAQIEFAAQSGLIQGYPDGTFQGERVINRAEALKLVFSFYKEGVPTDLRGEELLAHYEYTTNPATDLDLQAWYAPYVVAAYHCGIVQGYPDGTFLPGKEVSHAEFLKIATLVQNIDQTVELASELQ